MAQPGDLAHSEQEFAQHARASHALATHSEEEARHQTSSWLAAGRRLLLPPSTGGQQDACTANTSPIPSCQVPRHSSSPLLPGNHRFTVDTADTILTLVASVLYGIGPTRALNGCMSLTRDTEGATLLTLEVVMPTTAFALTRVNVRSRASRLEGRLPLAR